jgi:tRNA pseudouridine55 synthase
MIDGALLLDKPVGLSSNAALQQAKRALGVAKAGHAGTLDPLASGLLIVLLGEATKLSGLMMDADKEYVATLKLGEKTSTGDAEGGIIATKPVGAVQAQLPRVLDRFRGELEQVPPMYSALKRSGVPLYQLARKGTTVERKPRVVTIRDLAVIRVEEPLVVLRVRCSKGTYVRTLAEDIGEALGTYAHLAALRRTASGRWRVEQAATLDRVRSQAARQILSLSALLADLPRAELSPADEACFRNGQALESALTAGMCAVYGAAGEVLGLGLARDGRLRPLRLLAASQAADKHPKSL